MQNVFANLTPDEKTAKYRFMIEAIRWPNGVRCIKCDSPSVSAQPSYPGRYYCKACKTRFTVTTGTVFAASRLTPRALYIAITSACRHDDPWRPRKKNFDAFYDNTDNILSFMWGSVDTQHHYARWEESVLTLFSRMRKRGMFKHLPTHSPSETPTLSLMDPLDYRLLTYRELLQRLPPREDDDGSYAEPEEDENDS